MFKRGITLTAAGVDGSATATSTLAIPTGRLIAVAYNALAQPNTTDVTLTLVGPGLLERTLFTITSSNTDFGWTDVVNDPIDQANAAVTGVERHPFVDGSIRIDVDDADDTEDLRIWIAIEPIGGIYQ